MYIASEKKLWIAWVGLQRKRSLKMATTCIYFLVNMSANTFLIIVFEKKQRRANVAKKYSRGSKNGWSAQSLLLLMEFLDTCWKVLQKLSHHQHMALWSIHDILKPLNVSIHTPPQSPSLRDTGKRQAQTPTLLPLTGNMPKRVCTGTLPARAALQHCYATDSSSSSSAPSRT